MITDKHEATQAQRQQSVDFGSGTLFDRVVSILELAKSNVARTINVNMVTAYWLIGYEIVNEIQGGKERAKYGSNVLEMLAKELNNKYGSGFSVTNLKYFRSFYQTYADRISGKGRPLGDELQNLTLGRPSGDESELEGFSSSLSWSHYRALMRVEKPDARIFYEKEAIACGWNKRELERQIHSFYYERLLASPNKKAILIEERGKKRNSEPAEILKSPHVLEFLNLPDAPKLHESELEQAIINNLQMFLLELGKGFSFVARQKRLLFEDKIFYVDLVFYNYILKCFLLIDLKIGELTHQDIGQMDGYVRMYEDLFKIEGDNPTIGLILCSEKNETIAKYSVLQDNKLLFASKYMLYLPSEDEMVKELQRERMLIEQRLEENSDKE